MTYSATAPVKSLSGTALAPGVTFTTDTDTGLFRPQANELSVAVGGVERSRFTLSGMRVEGDITLNDGVGTFITTVQTVTPTANRTISFPDATGTVGLVAGSNGQTIYNNNGVYAGISTMTFDGSRVTLSGRLINSYTSVASSPAKVFTGTWFTGGSSTTTKPHVLLEPAGTTSTAWSISGTGLGVNAASGFAGNLLDVQVNGSRIFSIGSNGALTGTSSSLVSTSSAGLQPATSFATITYAATTTLDLDSLNGQYRTISLTGNLTFATSNLANGRSAVIRLVADGTTRTLSFPAGWKFVGVKPTNILASKTAVLSLNFFGSTNSDCVAAYGVEA